MGGAFAELSGKQLWGLHGSQRGNIDSGYLSLSLYDSLGKLGFPQDVIAPIIPMPAHTPDELHSFKLQARPVSGLERQEVPTGITSHKVCHTPLNAHMPSPKTSSTA